MSKKHAFKYPWVVVFGMAMSFFLASYDTTAFNLALVSIQKDLSLSLSELDWVMTSMMIALGTFLIPGGKISDKFGHKGPMIVGLLFFTLVSALGGFATNAWQLITLRILQGAFAALFWPGMQTLSLYAVPEKNRTLSVGISQFAGALGIAVGPLISGFVLSLLNWRWVFWTTVPISLLSMLILAIFIPKDAFPKHKEKIDLISAFFLSACAFSTIHTLDLLGRYGINSSSTLAWAAISVALFWFFVIRDDNIKNPLINLEILKNKRFVAGVGLRIVSATVYFSFLFLTGFALQQIVLLPADKAGIFFLPLTIGLMAFSLGGGLLGKFIDSIKLMYTGFFIFCVSCFVYAIVVQHSIDFWMIVTPLGLMGIGFGIFGTMNGVFTLGSLPKHLVGTGAGVMVMMLMVFGSVGIVVSSIFIRIVGVQTALDNLTNDNITLTQGQKLLVEMGVSGKKTMREVLALFGENAEKAYLAMREGFFDAMSWNLFTIGTIGLSVMLITMFFHYSKKSRLFKS